MNINIYYGGRGLIEDPTLNVIEKIEKVLEELNVNVARYNLYETKNAIATLPQTLKEANGCILAVNVEWFGIGGFMQQFLDACWLYGDKERLKSVYMLPVVIATTYGEQEALTHLKTSWELIGGNVCGGIATYVKDALGFDLNEGYTKIIEAETENLYRYISQKRVVLPTSNSIKKSAIRESVHLTPEESDQLSKYVSDDDYVKTQKEDIEELTSMFKGMLETQANSDNKGFVPFFLNNFKPTGNYTADYQIEIEDEKKFLYIYIENKVIECRYEKHPADIIMRLSKDTLDDIVHGKLTFQHAFNSGEMKAKGNFNGIRMLDQLFKF